MNRNIRAFIESKILTSPLDFTDDDSLYDMNILNSLSLVRLVSFINNELSIKIDLVDILDAEEFETINNITRFLKRHATMSEVAV